MHFIKYFSITSIITFTILYGMILAIDPYNKLGNNLFGFETKAVDFARVNKFNQVEYSNKNYTAFVMGSSSAHRYSTKELNNLTGLISYNYSTQSATPEDFLAMTRHILKRYKPKLFLISLDFEVLNQRVKTDEMFFASPLKDYLNEVPEENKTNSFFNNSYLTLEALGDSFKVIWVNLFGKANHAYLEDGDHVVGPLSKEVKIVQYSGGPYIFDTQRIEYLKTIKHLCDLNGVKIIAFTSPLSLDHLKRIEEDQELKLKLSEFKNVLVNIFGEVWDFQNETIAPYNSVEYFYNSNHPTHTFSTIVLSRMISNTDGPGVRLKK